MKQLKLVVAATALALIVGHPALAACKVAAGQPAKCQPKPAAQVRPAGLKPCVIAGKPGPCKVKTHQTDTTAHVAYKF